SGAGCRCCSASPGHTASTRPSTSSTRARGARWWPAASRSCRTRDALVVEHGDRGALGGAPGAQVPLQLRERPSAAPARIAAQRPADGVRRLVAAVVAARRAEPAQRLLDLFAARRAQAVARPLVQQRRRPDVDGDPVDLLGDAAALAQVREQVADPRWVDKANPEWP